jgi:hypothetical protein
MKTLVLWLLGSVLGLIAAASWRTAVPGETDRTSGLAALRAVVPIVALALVTVGFVSGTVLPHLVQILPLLAGLALCWLAPASSVAVVRGLLAFWLATMAGIWLFLLGVSRFLTGHFSAAEIVLTLVIGAAASVGLMAARSSSRPLTVASAATVIVAAGVQAFALWLSYQPVIVGH